jgi:hypothetical protein
MDVEGVQPLNPAAAWTDYLEIAGACITVAVAAGISALLLLRRLRLRHRLRNDLCLVCGYSLHGNISGICPECGGLISARSRLLGY